MATVSFEEKVVEVIVDGVSKWCPAINLGNHGLSLVSHRGNILIYDTKEEAENYFEE